MLPLPQPRPSHRLPIPAGGGTAGSDAEGGEFEALLEVAAVREVTLDGCLAVDPVTLEALGIFAQERHPSAMGIGTPQALRAAHARVLCAAAGCSRQQLPSGRASQLGDHRRQNPAIPGI